MYNFMITAYWKLCRMQIDKKYWKVNNRVEKVLQVYVATYSLFNDY